MTLRAKTTAKKNCNSSLWPSLLWGLCVPLLVQCSHTQGTSNSSSSPTESDCLSAYESLSKNRRNFYGYGEGSTLDDATAAARADLAKQLVTTIQSSVTTIETNRTVDLKSVTTSSVSRELAATQVEKRCAGQPRAAVVSLKKAVFTRSLGEQLQQTLGETTPILDLSASAKPADQVVAYFQGNRFLASHGSQLQTDYLICRTFKGCLGINMRPLEQLQDFTAKNAGLNQFRYAAKTPLSAELQETLVSLALEQGINIVPGDTNNQCISACQQKVYPETLGNQVVGINCDLLGLADGTEVFQLTYSSRGVGATAAEALAAAKNQLQLEQP